MHFFNEAMVVRHRRGNAKEERGSFNWLVQAGIERISKDEAGMFELINLDRSKLFTVGGAGMPVIIKTFIPNSKSKQFLRRKLG